MSIRSLSLKLRPEDIPMLLDFADRASPGKHTFSQTFSYDTMKSSVVTAAYLGHITLVVDGHVHIGKRGFANQTVPDWRFRATLRALPRQIRCQSKQPSWPDSRGINLGA
ncbi:lipid II-degrading bacteriocin [Allopusillimonas ginsengisoli]|nr:lipid II-degrading bacteriocin [Allopusillimonas ginsengisoli]